MSHNEFYIGWMPAAPARIMKRTKRMLLVLALLIVTTAVLLAMLQRKFSTAVFEFGKLTEIKGIYMEYPVPAIKAISGSDFLGRREYLTIPLSTLR